MWSRRLLLGLLLLAVALLLFFLPGTRPRPAAPARVSPTAAAPAVAAAPARPTEPPSPDALIAASGARAVAEPALASGAISGRVVNFSTGGPVAAAQVTFSSEGGTASVASDGEGRFELIPPRPGRYLLAIASATGFLPYAPEWDQSPVVVMARPGLRIRDVTIFLRPALDYTGVVLDPDGKPVAGATITLLGAGAGEQASSPLADRFTSDGHGEFVFHAPDDALLEARHPAYAPGRARVDGAVTVSHHLELRLGARGADDAALGRGEIRGRVVRAGGTPVAGALVRAVSLAEGGEHPRAEAVAGEDGRFTLAGLDPGQHAVTARCSGCPLARGQAPTGGELVLTMGASATLTGRVVDGTGAPVASFTVIVTRVRGIAEDLVTDETFMDGEGRFELTGLDAGDVRVRAAAAGFAPSPPADARLGDEPAEVLLRAPRGGSLRGQVLERDTAKPLEFARLTVEGSSGADGPTVMALAATAVTDATGAFVLAGVAPGRRSILAAAGGHHMRIISGLTVEDGVELGPLRIELTALRDGETPTVELFGIGAALRGADDALLIDKIFDGGGAALAGLRPGDAIVRIDGAGVLAIGFQDAVQRIRGPEGTRLLLGVRRGRDLFDVSVERRRIVF